MLKRYSHRRSLWALIISTLALVHQSIPGYGADGGSKQESAPQAAAPEFSVRGGIYTSNLSVRLSGSAKAIHYTIDGSEPTEQSPSYSRPVRITSSTVIRARAFSAGATPSPIVAQSYTLTDRDMADFSSNLPLVIINAFGHVIERDSKVPAYIKVIGLSGNRSHLSGKVEYDGRTSISLHGNTSLRYSKRSYHFKMRDESGSPLKLPILGFPKESDWILYAPYPDKTLMRDVLAYELSNKIGDYAPRTRFVEVFVSYSGKVTMRDYMGVYVFEEKIKRDKARVNIARLEPGDSNEPEISGGYIFKKDHLDRSRGGGMPNDIGMPDMRHGSSSVRSGFPTGPGGFPAKPEGFLKPYGSSFSSNNGSRSRKVNGQNAPGADPVIQDTPLLPGFSDETISPSLGFSTPKGNQFFYVEPKADEITNKQKAWLKRYIGRLEKALYGPNFRDPTNGYAAYLDADSFIDHHLLVEATKNVDGFRFSTFYYKDRGGKIRMGPIWDWNLALGDVNGKQGWMPRYWYWPQLDDQQYSWFRRLFQDPDFAQKYVDRWAALRTNVFATASVLSRIDQIAALLKEPQARNFERWPILGRTVWPNHFVGATFQDEVNWIKNYIETRFSWIDEQFVSAPGFSLKPGAIPANSKLSLTGPSDKSHRIYYTLDGTDPRAAGGAPSDSAKTYDGPIPLKENARIFTRAAEGNLWSAPSVGEFRLGKK